MVNHRRAYTVESCFCHGIQEGIREKRIQETKNILSSHASSDQPILMRPHFLTSNLATEPTWSNHFPKSHDFEHMRLLENINHNIHGFSSTNPNSCIVEVAYIILTDEWAKKWYIYIYMYRERGRERDKQTDKDGKTEGNRERYHYSDMKELSHLWANE